MIDSESAFGFETVVVATTPVGIPLSAATRAILTLADGQIRFRYDGAAPSSTTGHIMDIGDFRVLEGSVNIRQFLAVRTGGTSGILSVTLERH